MNRRLSLSLFIAIAGIAVPIAPSLATVHEVNVQNFSFSPADITIDQGDTVRWVWVSGNHTTTSGDPGNCDADGLWDAPLNVSNASFEHRFNDVGVLPYFCRPHCLSGMSGSITVEQNVAAVEEELLSGLGERSLMLRVAPTPFSDFAILSFQLAHPEHVRLDIFDAGGRRVAALGDRRFEAGMHQLSWDGRSSSGVRVPAGVYYARRPTLSSMSATLVLVR